MRRYSTSMPDSRRSPWIQPSYSAEAPDPQIQQRSGLVRFDVRCEHAGRRLRRAAGYWPIVNDGARDAACGEFVCDRTADDACADDDDVHQSILWRSCGVTKKGTTAIFREKRGQPTESSKIDGFVDARPPTSPRRVLQSVIGHHAPYPFLVANRQPFADGVFDAGNNIDAQGLIHEFEPFP